MTRYPASEMSTTYAPDALMTFADGRYSMSAACAERFSLGLVIEEPNGEYRRASDSPAWESKLFTDAEFRAQLRAIAEAPVGLVWAP